MTFTSGIPYGGSDRGHDVEVRVNGVTGVKTLPNLPGNDYYPHKGDLWKISFRNDLHFYSCIRKHDIESQRIAMMVGTWRQLSHLSKVEIILS